jgi:hypothetical protein
VTDQGARTSFYGGNGTITELSTLAVPANPTAYNHWISGINLAQFGIANATPSTDITVVGYLSPATKAFAVRMFYQTTDGAIRTAFHSGVPGDVNWKLDSIVIAIGRLGTPLSAFQSNLNGVLPVGRRVFETSLELNILQEIVVVQYTDTNGLLSQSFTTTDDEEGNWSAAVTVTT